MWNEAGPSPGSMIILLGLLKDELEADQARLPTEFNRLPTKLLEFLVQEAGEDHNNQINFIKQNHGGVRATWPNQLPRQGSQPGQENRLIRCQ
jgi:hypothetical protein